VTIDGAREGPQVDVVIPTFQNADQLRRCLDSLAGQVGRLMAFVCVDGSTDGTLEFLRSVTYPFPLRVLEHDDRRNHGRSATRNLARWHVTAPYILFLDSDMQLAPGAIARHLVVASATRLRDGQLGRSGPCSRGRRLVRRIDHGLWR
jgi:glycosyltransferase involved in cell wall biosynthesis